MKKSLTIIFCVSLILILSFSVVSGSWFGDIWAKITGKAAAPAPALISCSDSDNGKNYFVKGTVIYSESNYTDYCSSKFLLVEYYCSNNSYGSVNYNCSYGCENGACLKVAPMPEDEPQVIVPEILPNNQTNVTNVSSFNQSNWTIPNNQTNVTNVSSFNQSNWTIPNNQTNVTNVSSFSEEESILDKNVRANKRTVFKRIGSWFGKIFGKGEEICNGIDDDGDGKVDEGCVGRTYRWAFGGWVEETGLQQGCGTANDNYGWKDGNCYELGAGQSIGFQVSNGCCGRA